MSVALRFCDIFGTRPFGELQYVGRGKDTELQQSFSMNGRECNLVTEGAVLTQTDRTNWDAKGWLAFNSFLTKERQKRLSEWIAEVARDPVGEGRRLHYHEATADGPRLCRTERFLEDHDGLRALITGPEFTGIAAALLGEALVLYKDKANYKYPGGTG